MDIKEIYVTTQHCSTRRGGTGEVVEYRNHQGLVELYAPALGPGEWFRVRVMAVEGDGHEFEVKTIIVKR